jgi:hypothetical protein
MHPSAPKPLHSLLTPSLGNVKKQISLAKRSLALQGRSGHLPNDGNMVGAGMQKVQMLGLVSNDRSKKATREELEVRPACFTNVSSDFIFIGTWTSSRTLFWSYLAG